MADILDQVFPSEDTAPAEPAAEPAPEAAPSQEPAPAAAAAPETPAPTAAPSVPETPQAQAPVLTPAEGYIKELAGQNKQFSSALQQVLEQQSALMQDLLKKNKPEMTPEERDAEIRKSFEELNTDPAAFIDKIVAARETRLREELEKKYAPRSEASERSQFVQESLARLYTDGKGRVLRPELGNTEFRNLVTSPEVSAAVYERLYKGEDPEAVIKKPEFFLELYHEARARGTAQFQPTKTQSATDAAAQGAILQGHGSPATGGGKPAQGAGAQAVSPEEVIRRGIMEAETSPMERLFRDSKPR
jgi:hypothetical protein